MASNDDSKMKVSKDEYVIAASDLRALGLTEAAHDNIMALLHAGADQLSDDAHRTT